MSVDLRSLARMLSAGRNTDGGWGYYPGKASRLEPTCWALLALPEVDAEVLQKWPVAGGLLLERGDGDPNYAFHALALLALLARSVEHERGSGQLLQMLQRVRGVSHKPSTINRQDHRFQGWSWVAETTTWVEPTAWALLALKKWSRAGVSIDGTRIRDGESVMIDRCCVSGGWNYGNSNMLGRELSAYVPTTAVALLGLQDQRTVPEVSRSIDYLERMSASENSGLALSLAILALKVLERNFSAASEALLRQITTTFTLGNHLGMAVTLLALDTDGESPLRL